MSGDATWDQSGWQRLLEQRLLEYQLRPQPTWATEPLVEWFVFAPREPMADLWPERQGLRCRIVDRPAGKLTYPWASLPDRSVVVLFEEDVEEVTVAGRLIRVVANRTSGQDWSCVLDVEDLVPFSEWQSAIGAAERGAVMHELGQRIGLVGLTEALAREVYELVHDDYCDRGW